MTITRRTFLSTTAALALPRPLPDDVAWLREVAPQLADMEVHAVRHDRPRDWREIAYVNSIDWRPGIRLVYAYAGDREFLTTPWQEALRRIEQDDQLVSQGWSACGRCWVGFVRTD